MSVRPTTMPIVFFGHGSPMIALQTNAVTETWRRMGESLPRPKAILSISAHWCTRGTSVTAMKQPQTIHDFGGFPQELFDMQYPAPGSAELAARVRDLLQPMPVTMDQSWGFDHGTWTVLTKTYSAADIPVVQLSMDARQTPAHHFEIGRRLNALRDEGILIMGTGNVVHNLPLMNWSMTAKPYAWAQQFHDYVHNAIVDDQPERLVHFTKAGDPARLAVPTPDHYWPLLYVLGARRTTDVARFEVDHIEHSSLSMMTVSFAPAADGGRAPG